MSTPLFRILPASYLAAWIRGVHPDMPTHLDQWTTVSLPGAPGSIIAPHPKNQFKLGNGEWRQLPGDSCTLIHGPPTQLGNGE